MRLRSSLEENALVCEIFHATPSGSFSRDLFLLKRANFAAVCVCPCACLSLVDIFILNNLLKYN